MASERWTTVRLGDTATVMSGGTPSKQRSDFWGGSFPWVSAKDLKTPVICTSELSLTEEGKKAAKLAPEGSVLILVRGMTLLKDVPVGFAGREVAFNQDIKALVPTPGISGRFLSHVLTASKHRLLGLVNVAGHGTGRLDTELLKDFTYDLPDPEEQRRIVEILGAWEEAIRTLQRLIAAKRERKRGLMQVLLTGKKRFKEFEGSAWQKKSLRKMASHISRGIAPHYTVNETRTLAINQRCIRDGRVHLESARSHEQSTSVRETALLIEGDVCINSTGTGTAGRVGLWNDPADGRRYFVDSHVTIVRPKKNVVDPKFLIEYLSTARLQYQLQAECSSGGTNQIELNRSALERLTIALPSLEEQKKISALLSNADAEIRNTQIQLETYELQKRGLMQQLLTGKKRIRVEGSEPVPV